jgi:hypothetical protein
MYPDAACTAGTSHVVIGVDMSSKSFCSSEIVVLGDLLQRDTVVDAGDEVAES